MLARVTLRILPASGGCRLPLSCKGFIHKSEITQQIKAHAKPNGLIDWSPFASYRCFLKVALQIADSKETRGLTGGRGRVVSTQRDQWCDVFTPAPLEQDGVLICEK